mgnify:FL=1
MYTSAFRNLELHSQKSYKLLEYLHDVRKSTDQLTLKSISCSRPPNTIVQLENVCVTLQAC